jgi:predicted HTH transcriptional regulator
MAQDTTRDQLWAAAIKRAVREDQAVTATWLSKTTGVSTRTCRDFLKTAAKKRVLRAEPHGREVRYVADLTAPEAEN